MDFRELTDDERNEINQRRQAISEEQLQLKVRMDELYTEDKKLHETLMWGPVE